MPATLTAPVEEVTGSFRWLETPDPAGMGRIRINGKEYPVAVSAWAGQPVVQCGEYRVVNEGARWRCECPDFKFRRSKTCKGCKHTAALRAAFRQLKVGVPTNG